MNGSYLVIRVTNTKTFRIALIGALAHMSHTAHTHIMKTITNEMEEIRNENVTIFEKHLGIIKSTGDTFTSTWTFEKSGNIGKNCELIKNMDPVNFDWITSRIILYLIDNANYCTNINNLLIMLTAIKQLMLVKNNYGNFT